MNRSIAIFSEWSFEAPSPVQSRYVTRDVEHYGQTIPEGSVMVLINAAANRDPARFADPELAR